MLEFHLKNGEVHYKGLPEHRTQGLLDCGVQSENIRETQEKTELQRLLRHDGQDKVRGVRVQFPQSHRSPSSTSESGKAYYCGALSGTDAKRSVCERMC